MKKITVVYLLIGVFTWGCSSDHFIKENLVVKSIWTPSNGEGYFVAITDDGRTMQYRIRKRRIPDGEEIWASGNIPGDAIRGSLFNSADNETGFWLSGKNHITYYQPEGTGIVEKKRLQTMADNETMGHPRLHSCKLNKNGTFVASDEYVNLIWLKNNKWKKVKGDQGYGHPLCIAENLFITAGYPVNQLLYGMEISGKIEIKKIVEVAARNNISLHAYSKKYNMLAVYSSNANNSNVIDLYKLDLSGNAPKATYQSQLVLEERTLQGMVFHPDKPYLLTAHRQTMELKLWNFDGKLIGKYTTSGEYNISDIIFTSKGSYIVVVMHRGYVIKKTSDVFPMIYAN